MPSDTWVCWLRTFTGDPTFLGHDLHIWDFLAHICICNIILFANKKAMYSRQRALESPSRQRDSYPCLQEEQWEPWEAFIWLSSVTFKSQGTSLMSLVWVCVREAFILSWAECLWRQSEVKAKKKKKTEWEDSLAKELSRIGSHELARWLFQFSVLLNEKESEANSGFPRNVAHCQIVDALIQFGGWGHWCFWKDLSLQTRSPSFDQRREKRIRERRRVRGRERAKEGENTKQQRYPPFPSFYSLFTL